MTPEKIIANIENYISTLTPAEQELCETCLNVAESSCTNVKDIPSIKDSILKHHPVLELVEIIQELKRDIKEKMQKSTKGKSFVTRSKKLTKLMLKNTRESYKKAVIEEINGIEMQCCVVDGGFYAFVLKEHLDVPMFTPEESKNYNNEFHSGEFKNCIPPYEDYKTVEFDIANIKAKLSLHKAKKDKTVCRIEIDGTIFNAEYFVNVIDILGENVTMYKHPTKINEMVVFENNNGIGILCTMRR